MYNLNIFCYRLIHRLLKYLKIRQNNKDDFIWDVYDIHYIGELKEYSRKYTLIIKKGDYLFQGGRLYLENKDILTLNPYHAFLYETILQLNPQSVMEIGCGGGDHLHNISIFSPEMELYGIDISLRQICFLKKRHPRLKAGIKQFDCTSSFWGENDIKKVDLVFTQSVLMHIQSEDRYLTALSNMFKIATKYVVVMENFSRHSFIDDIKKIYNLGNISWPEMFIYYQRLNFLDPTLADLLIVSAEPLSRYQQFLITK